MASIFTPISAISGGKKNLKLIVRVAHIWLIRDKDHPDDIIFMNMLLVDEKRGRIHATVRKYLVPTIQQMVAEGGTYKLENVMVQLNEGIYKLLPHKHKLSMMNNTRFVKVNASNIPLNVFEFMSFKDILLSHEEDKVADVIGHVVERDTLRETDKNGRKSLVIDLTLEDLEHSRIHCSLWGEFASDIDRYFDNHDNSKPVVLIIQLGRLRKYMGAMGVANSFYGSKVVINGDLPEVTDYINRLGNVDVDLSQGVSQRSSYSSRPTAEELLESDRMTIEDLIESKAACHGAVLATICEIETGVEWFFRSCTQCASLVTLVDGKLSCKRCKECKSAVPRFKLHLIVMDDTGSTTFVLFDRIVTQFIGRNVQDLIAEMNKPDNKDVYPPEFNFFVDKRMLFKVEVSDGNVNRNWRNYGVKKATDDVEVIDEFIKKYSIKCSGEGDQVESALDNTALGSDANNLEIVDLVESVSSSNKLDTPSTKSGTKRSSGGNDSVRVGGLEHGEQSINKPTKMVRVKFEPSEDK